MRKETPVDDWLNHVGIFSLLADDEISLIRKHFKLIDIPAGEILFREGDEGKELFIVKSGKVAITIGLSDGKQRELREFSKGDFFGEMSIFENAPRSATCVAKERSGLYSLHVNDFFEIMERSPETSIKIMYRMSNATTERFQHTSEFLSDLVRWGEKARKRAITDELTGVYNRHFLEHTLEDLFKSSKDKKTPFCLIMVDLDFFREINKQYGHETGDRVILAVVEVFKKNLKEKDIIARYGGDEFCVVMPQTGPKEAENTSWKICREVEGLDVLKGKGGSMEKITTSQGIASYPESARDLKTLRQKADQALYRSKEAGRNRVSV
ncbi:MAG: GGDEF domain-containing protein [Spirochaetes bacterium]|nr:GGDEF domain-containing protein [Spirochaetota bacterium]